MNYISICDGFLFHLCFQEKRQVSFEYGRYGNPTTVVLEEKIRLVFGSSFVPLNVEYISYIIKM